MEKSKSVLTYIRSVTDAVSFNRDYLTDKQLTIHARSRLGENEKQGILRFTLECDISSGDQNNPFFKIKIYSFFKSNFDSALTSEEIQSLINKDDKLRFRITNPPLDWLLNIFSTTTSWGVNRPLSLSKAELAKGLLAK